MHRCAGSKWAQGKYEQYRVSVEPDRLSQTWRQYQEWGDESLDRIVDPGRRKFVELRFLLAILKTDPGAYTVRVFIVTVLRQFPALAFVADHDLYPPHRLLSCGVLGGH